MAPDVQGRAGGVRALYFSPLKTYLVTYEILSRRNVLVKGLVLLIVCFGFGLKIGRLGFYQMKWDPTISSPYKETIKAFWALTSDKLRTPFQVKPFVNMYHRFRVFFRMVKLGASSRRCRISGTLYKLQTATMTLLLFF